MKKSVLGRSAKLLGMASKMAQTEVAHKIRKGLKSKLEDIAPEVLATRIKQAEILTQNLSQLKGAAMKAGQLLSIDSSDILPPEVIEILSKLQNSAEPVPFPELDAVMKQELPFEAYGSLQDLDTKAYAAASIGQVHRAHFNNEDVVLKIQYPGVTDTIDSDLNILKKVVGAMLRVSGKPIPLNEVFEELSILLHQEADYRLEKQNLEKFNQLLKDSPHYVVPKPIDALCSEKVLGMTYVEGVPIKQWLDQNPSMQEKQSIGQLVLDLYCKEFFDWGIVQTDPNYGNFKVQSEPLKLVLLDFGATVTYDRPFIENYVQLLKDFASFDRKRMLQSALDFQLLDPRESDEVKDLFVEFLKSAVEPFLPHLQPFSFNDKDYTEKAQRVGRQFTSALKYSPPPRQLLFLHRKLGGIFNLLRKMQVQLDLTPYWDKMVGEKMANTSSLSSPQ